MMISTTMMTNQTATTDASTSAHAPALCAPALCAFACAFVFVFVGALACGCSDGKTPSLSSLHYDGASPDSSLVLLLSTQFDDPDGDLATCTAAQADTDALCILDTFINGKPTSAGPLELLPLFVQAGLPSDAPSGTLHFVLELSFDGAPPPDGSTFTLGARVSDAAQNTSSTQELKLKLTEQ